MLKYHTKIYQAFSDTTNWDSYCPYCKFNVGLGEYYKNIETGCLISDLIFILEHRFDKPTTELRLSAFACTIGT